MIWATVHSQSCFCWMYNASPSLAAKNIINMISVLTIWWFPCVESSLVFFEECVCNTSVLSWWNSTSLFSASFCTPRPNLPVTPSVSWFAIFAFQSPITKKTSFLGVGSGMSCRSQRTVQLQFLQYYWSWDRLWLLWYLMICLGHKQRSFCHFSACIQILHFWLMLTMMTTSFLLKDSCPQ